MQAPPTPNTSFATLTPSNIQAKIAFDEVYDYFITHGEAPACFSVEPHREFNREVFLLRRRNPTAAEDSEVSDTPTDPDTDLEDELTPLGEIWMGRYTFSLDNEPSRPSRGWMVGRGRQDVAVDIQLTTNRPNFNVRGFHALFNLHTSTGYLWICRATGSIGLELTVNGEEVGKGQRFALNQTPMRIRLGRCEYLFEYTEYARSNSFKKLQRDYMTRYLNVLTENLDLGLTPTPNPQSRMIGEWTLGMSLGKGTFGKVFVGTNVQNEIVAVKIVERGTRTQASVAEEIRILEELKKLGEKEDDQGRLVRLKQVIYQNGREEYTSKRFEDVALILEPAVRGDFLLIVEEAANLRLRRGRLMGGMSTKATELFFDALCGINFLHKHNWLHGDIKPANIGIEGNRAVLLDIGGAMHIPPGHKAQSNPGRGGTIWYLAPEREMRNYDKLVDIWALGIIGYELSYGYHPLKLKLNPWRRGPQYEALRPDYQHMYNDAMRHLQESLDESDENHYNPISLLLTQMLRHPWAPNNNEKRINSAAAVQHICWPSDDETVDMDDSQRKRLRSQ